MAQFAESQTKCESQEVYWAICEKRWSWLEFCQQALWDHDFHGGANTYQVSCSKWW
jgi:hypothetical protein